MKTILYLDDSSCALRLLDRILQDHVHVLCCSSAAAAAAEMGKHKIDCFLVDHMLGDTDGISFAREVRATEGYAETPIILVSAGITSEVAHRAMRSRINQCVCKPFTPDSIRAVVSAQLENPTIHEVDRPRVTTVCTVWEADHVFYQFSPDTKQVVSASTSEEAHARMHAMLREWVDRSGKEVEAVLDTNVVRHIFDLA